MDSDQGSQSHWIPLADLMTGLMMVFMLLTAAFMLRVEQTTTLVVKEYEETKSDMLRALQKEFAENLKQWNAELLGDMTIRFNDPTVLFATGSAELRPQFKEVLREFFPRYVTLLISPRFKDAIREIRIEGHTSLFWATDTPVQTAYFLNMALSQARTRTTLEFLLTLPGTSENIDWLIAHVTANGLSSSRPVGKNVADSKGQILNQRVEFRILTNANERMEQIAKEIGSR